MYIFLFLGLFVIITPFFAQNLKHYSLKVKAIVFGIFWLVGGGFTYIGGKAAYEDFFREFPPLTINDFSENIFSRYNTVQGKINGEEIIDLKTESKYMIDWEDGYCSESSYERFFKAIDKDSDDVLTRKELYQAIAEFDTNRDGMIDYRKAGIKTIFGHRQESESERFWNTYYEPQGKRYRCKD